MKKEYFFDEIKALLPQKYPFIFIDRIQEVYPREKIICLKNISGNEWMFPGHFPEKSIFPGVLIIEAIAQASILLFKIGQESSEKEENGEIFLLTNVKSRFLDTITPGDQVIFTCEVIKMYESAGMIKATAMVEGKIVAKADLTFAIKR
ncbi:3-hydroxyacyl-ACP dehydratase FabZ [Cytobacillus dafuensis]|uniref:3-hydroxyacyl-[acyl-carrier-protein] dehydratase n=1 Tax=Cytobacillus dafuensis TaxID=1742359 RepID=A0A5B8Z1X4_CYTDA|nr:3-hydroxyacyl-ACP dehydratase FabZ [Cytobacillus dafuensis]QED47024.1 beta-hydroxyacyl-ACP dehydratase [Cytobacillus dafuensis]